MSISCGSNSQALFKTWCMNDIHPSFAKLPHDDGPLAFKAKTH
jgi:hypothetical protein